MHEPQFGRYGRMHRQYLKQDRPVLYIAMVMDGNLWPYLEELNFPTLAVGSNTVSVTAANATFTGLEIQARSRWR